MYIASPLCTSSRKYIFDLVLQLDLHHIFLFWLIGIYLTVNINQGLYSLSGKTSYRKISWSLEAAWFGFKLFQSLWNLAGTSAALLPRCLSNFRSLWNLAGTSAALLPRCLSNFRAIRPLQHTISRLRDFTRFGGKTSYRLVNRGPEYYLDWMLRCWRHIWTRDLIQYKDGSHLSIIGNPLWRQDGLPTVLSPQWDLLCILPFLCILAYTQHAG